MTTQLQLIIIMENENFKLYWNRSILADKTIPCNRPDITCMNTKTKNAFLIDIAVPNTHNLAKTVTNKLAPEYIYTTAKICNSWHMFNCKKLFKLEIRPPRLILLITTTQDG
jgi:hypothetical protein